MLIDGAYSTKTAFFPYGTKRGSLVVRDVSSLNREWSHFSGKGYPPHNPPEGPVTLTFNVTLGGVTVTKVED